MTPKVYLYSVKAQPSEFSVLIRIGNHMISSTIWNKEAWVNISKTNNLWSSKEFTNAYLFQTAREKSCDYVLILHMKKYEIASHNCAEARASSAIIFYSDPASSIVRSVKTTAFDQNSNMQWYSVHIFKAQKSSNSGYTVKGIVQSGLLLLCTELTLFYIELPENCIYLYQFELSNFFVYLINKKNINILFCIKIKFPKLELESCEIGRYHTKSDRMPPRTDVSVWIREEVSENVLYARNQTDMFSSFASNILSNWFGFCLSFWNYGRGS